MTPSAACENQLVRLRAQKRGEIVARIINGGASFAAGRMHARWISKVPIKIGQHRLARFVTEWRRRVVIEINHRMFDVRCWMFDFIL